MTLDLFPTLDVSPVTLRGAMSSRGDVPFAFNDVVFGYQVATAADLLPAAPFPPFTNVSLLFPDNILH